MSLSSFSLMLGVYGYLYGFPLVFSEEQHLIWRKKMLADENILRLLGTAFIMASVTTLRYNWRITVDGEGIVITIAWLTFLKSLFMVWWPRRFALLITKVETKIFATKHMQMFVGYIVVLLGALFTYFGLVFA